MMELLVRLLMVMLAGVTVSRARGNSSQEGSDYWPTRSELVMPGGRKGAAVPVGTTDERTEVMQSGGAVQSGGTRRSKAVVISVNPGNQDPSAQQQGTITAEQWRGRQRNKNARLFMLQQQIMQELRLKHKPNVTGSESLSPKQIEKLERQMSLREKSPPRRQPSRSGHHVGDEAGDDPRDTMAEERGDGEYNSKRFLALPASCPQSAQEWFTEGSRFRLFFLVDPPIESRDRKTRVTSAVLRLHRKSYGTLDDNAADTGDNADDDVVDEERGTWQRERAKRGHTGRMNEREERRRRKRVNERSKRTLERRNKGSDRLTLTVYQYTQPVQHSIPEVRRKVKSLTLKYPHVMGEGNDWVRINVKGAVREWYKEPETNYGLELVVMDENNVQVDPRLVFHGFNCSDSTTAEDAAALMSLSMQDDEEESGEWGVSYRIQSPAQRIKSILPTITIPNLYLSTVDTPRRDRRRRLRRRRGDRRHYP